MALTWLMVDFRPNAGFLVHTDGHWLLHLQVRS